MKTTILILSILAFSSSIFANTLETYNGTATYSNAECSIKITKDATGSLVNIEGTVQGLEGTTAPGSVMSGASDSQAELTLKFSSINNSQVSGLVFNEGYSVAQKEGGGGLSKTKKVSVITKDKVITRVKYNWAINLLLVKVAGGSGSCDNLELVSNL